MNCLSSVRDLSQTQLDLANHTKAWLHEWDLKTGWESHSNLRESWQATQIALTLSPKQVIASTRVLLTVEAKRIYSEQLKTRQVLASQAWAYSCDNKSKRYSSYSPPGTWTYLAANHGLGRVTKLTHTGLTRTGKQEAYAGIQTEYFSHKRILVHRYKTKQDRRATHEQSSNINR